MRGRAFRGWPWLAAAVVGVACVGEAEPRPERAPAPEPAAVSAPVHPPPAVCPQVPPGPAFHRLNRAAYENAVNQLLGTRLRLRERLPPDEQLFGFDNAADTAVSAALVQRYLDLAREAVEAALADPASRGRLIPCDPATDAAFGRRVLAAFLPAAFRRPVSTAEIDQHLGHAIACDEGGPPTVEGLGCALQAALISPDFLFRIELPGDARAFALATRLSFFLQSTAPDAGLTALAARGALDDPAVLQAQVERLLAPAAQARVTRGLVDSFPAQWLGLDGLEAAAPAGVVPELRQAMLGEARLFFAEILQQNRSALELVRAPFTFANQRLAAHYGLPGVPGSDLRRVDTRGRLRGGVLTQGSFLTLTSSGGRTSVPARARWVLQNLLCTPLPDPPPGAREMVPAPDPALGLTRRQSLEQRTSGPACSGCHQSLDPIGFGLETFDATGAERREEDGRPIDASGALPDGQRFAGTDELLELLAADPRFPACLTRKLLTYALGRGLDGPCDEAVVQSLADELAKDGYRLRNHVVRIVESELFRAVGGTP